MQSTDNVSLLNRPTHTTHAKTIRLRGLIGDAENARHELAGHENAAPCCRGGNCETWKCEKRDSMEHRVLHMSVHCRAAESFHSALRRRVKVAHPNLYTFLGHLQRATADSETKIARLNRGMSIRRCKKRMHQPGEWCARARYDSGAYTRVQFLDVF